MFILSHHDLNDFTVSSTFFYFLKGNNSPYGALKCHVSTGVMADTTTITRIKAVSLEERHRRVAS